MILAATIAATTIIESSLPIRDAFAHGVPTCLDHEARCVLEGMNLEQFSTHVLNMSNESQSVLIINGTTKFESISQLGLTPYISVDPASNLTDSIELNNLLRQFYPLYNDPSSWY